jgi:cofilin
MTRGFATIKPECEETFDAVKETDALNFVIYEASANGKTIYDSPTGDAPRHKLVFITWYVARFNLDG